MPQRWHPRVTRYRNDFKEREHEVFPPMWQPGVAHRGSPNRRSPYNAMDIKELSQ